MRTLGIPLASTVASAMASGSFTSRDTASFSQAANSSSGPPASAKSAACGVAV
jgi:hypothetical protein